MAVRETIGSGNKGSYQVKKLPGEQKTNEGYGQGPVSVYVHTGVPQKWVQGAIKAWNEQVGFRAFALTKDHKQADVIVSVLDGESAKKFNVNPEGGFAGYGVEGSWTPSGKGHVLITPFEPQVANDPKWNDSYVQLVQHELGHTIGIDHPGPPGNPYAFAPMKDYTQKNYNTLQAQADFEKADAAGIMGHGVTSNNYEQEFIRSIRLGMARTSRLREQRNYG